MAENLLTKISSKTQTVEIGRILPTVIIGERINPTGTSGWGTLNVLLDWQATASLQLGLRLENLFDKAYREHASGIDASGRNIGLWVNYSFP